MKNRLEQPVKLRKRAESVLEAPTPPENIGNPSPGKIQKTFHDLRVHQIELEMQNEELRRIHAELDVSRARYVALYDLALHSN